MELIELKEKRMEDLKKLLEQSYEKLKRIENQYILETDEAQKIRCEKNIDTVHGEIIWLENQYHITLFEKEIMQFVKEYVKIGTEPQKNNDIELMKQRQQILLQRLAILIEGLRSLLGKLEEKEMYISKFTKPNRGE